MRPEDKPPYLAMIPRVFVRALRETVLHGDDPEHELSEGEATDLLIKREQAAYMKGLRCAADLLRVEVDAIEIAMKKDGEQRALLSRDQADDKGK